MSESKMAFLEYSFLFDASQAYSHLYEFEQDLSKFFRDRGFEPVIIKTIEGVGTKRILYLKKSQPLFKETPNPVGRPKTPAGILRDMSEHKPRKAEREFATRKLNLDKPFKRIG